MLTSIRGIAAATLVSGLALSAAPALAETAESTEITVVDTAAASDFDRAVASYNAAEASNVSAEAAFELSANVALVTDYRFRGVSLSGGELAIQGGFDVAHSSGLYVGTWGSSLEEDLGYGSTELDIYGGWSGDLAEGITADVGLLYYAYFDAPAGDFDYFEAYSSLGFGIGPAEATVGVAYAWDQDSLGDTDNLYIYTDIGVGIPNTALTLTGHVGYTDGFLTFTADGDAFDYSVGMDYALTDTLSLGVMYTGLEGPSIRDLTDDSILVSLSASF